MPVNLWQEIVESLTDAVLVLDRDSAVVAINPAAATMLGVSQVSQLAVAELLARNAWLRRMVDACMAGQNLSDPDARLRFARRDIAVSVEASPLFLDGGESAGVVLQLHDLAPHRTAAQTLVPGEPDLRLSPAGLAHEVKNPLTGIKGATELMAARFKADQRAQQYCEVILEGVKRITALVEQVLALSGPLRLGSEQVNIHRVLHGALSMAGLHPQAPPGIIVEQLFDPSIPEFSGDEGALERAFLNLIRNAAEAIGTSGRIRLRTRMESEFRLATGGRRRNFLRVEISDDGGGLDQEQIDQLFKPFFTTKASGTGLGLVLSQRIVSAHGGKIWAEAGGMERVDDGTEPSDGAAPEGRERRTRGATFKVTLPVDGADVPKREKA